MEYAKWPSKPEALRPRTDERGDVEVGFRRADSFRKNEDGRVRTDGPGRVG